jgi:transcriptional regulator with XRE-family HTH domain
MKNAKAPAVAAMEFDSEEMFEALDRERRHRRLTRAQAAAELGVMAGTWSYWSRGGKIGSDSVLRGCIWLNVDLKDFAKPRAKADAA